MDVRDGGRKRFKVQEAQNPKRITTSNRNELISPSFFELNNLSPESLIAGSRDSLSRWATFTFTLRAATHLTTTFYRTSSSAPAALFIVVLLISYSSLERIANGSDDALRTICDFHL